MSTKTIRIPLLIDASGRWCAYGYTAIERGEQPDWSMMDEVLDPDEPTVNAQCKWVKVTVTLPDEEEIAGEVEPA